MKRLLSLLILAFLCLFAKGQVVSAGKVIAIADGDTFTMLINGNRQVKVRLHGVDCPEKNQDFGSRARQFTSQLIFGKTVTVRIKNKDRYGRSIGLVVLPDRRILNEELLKAGLAWHYKQYDQSREWTALERRARAERKGLWSIKNPIAPWEYRRQGHKKKPSRATTYRTIPRPSSLCGALTASGAKCRRAVKAGGHCYQHSISSAAASF